MLIFFATAVNGQKNATIIGTVTDSTSVPLSEIKVRPSGERESVVTGLDGRFSIRVPSGKAMDIEFTYIGMLQKRVHLEALAPNEVFDMKNIPLRGNFNIKDVVINDSSRKNNRYMEVLNPP